MASRLVQAVPRRLSAVVAERMGQEPVVILQGARAVGKSTLLREIAHAHGRDILDLDDLATRDAVRADPALFVQGEGPVFVDEFQHVPELLDAIKAELNIDASPGRFVITGSTRYSTLPMAAQALTGRAHRIDVWPLAQSEIDRVPADFARVLLEHPPALVDPTPATTTREEYIRRAVEGGFPLALRRSRSGDRARWFDDYLALVIERDVISLTRVRQRQQLPRLLRQFAGQTGQMLNIANAARAVGMEESTAENYTRLLEAVFLIYRLPAWGTTLGSRAAAAPKIHVLDSGLSARLLRVTESKLAAASAAALAQFGHLLETFVVGELLKQLEWLDEPVAHGHWRTHDGAEVDLVVERQDGLVVAIEVKAGRRVRTEDLKGLRNLRDKLGDLFLGGVVLYAGTRFYTACDMVHVVPIERLWRTPVR